MIKVIIVDDHPIIRDGLSILIDGEYDMEVCAEASDVAEALQMITDTNPDVAIIDVALETGNGIELVKEVKSRFPKIPMLVWSMYDESLFAERAIQAGALGFVNKKYVRDTVVDAIRSILTGDVYLSPKYSAKVLNRLRRGEPIEAKPPTAVLTDRELESFLLIGQGLKTSEIAERMELTQNTVETYRSRIKEKLQLKHAAELVREATAWVLSNG